MNDAARLSLLALLLLALLLAGGGMVAALSRAVPATAPLLRSQAHSASRPSSTGAAAWPQITQFSVQQGPGGAMQATWAVAKADVVELDGRPVAARGAQQLHVAGPTRLVLSATSARGTVAHVLQVVPRPIAVTAPPLVLRLPAIQRFTAQPDSRTHRLMLAWWVSDATGVQLNGVPVESLSTRPIALAAQPVTYRLRASNELGVITRSLVLPARPSVTVVTVTLGLPSIDRFTLIHMRAGRPYALLWQTGNATRVTLNGRPVAARGALPLPAPIQSTIYQLVASSADGQATAQVGIVVSGSATAP